MEADKIKNHLLVFSGKGGVGKSTVAVNLAITLAKKGQKVGLLDADIHGPNLALMLGVQEKEIFSCGENFILPIEVNKNLSLVSIAYFIPKTDTPVIWRGPAKMKIIERFVREVSWGNLDWLIVDAPPGTGDEPLSIAQLLPKSRAIMVTTPQEVSLLDSSKAINFAKELKLKVSGLIENMSGLACPHCGKKINIFKKDGGKRVAKQYKIPFLGSIPIDPEIVTSGDNGIPVVMNKNSEITKIFSAIVEKLLIKKRS